MSGEQSLREFVGMVAAGCWSVGTGSLRVVCPGVLWGCICLHLVVLPAVTPNHPHGHKLPAIPKQLRPPPYPQTGSCPAVLLKACGDLPTVHEMRW